jgi:hypothetical protein
MWNAWLDLEVTEEDYNLEAIEDGSHEHTFEDYKNLITKSLEEMFRVLKFDRWMSFVFAHKDPKYWQFIVDTARRVGFEYRGTVAQPNGQTSFKKRQNPFTTLSGQLIINFYKATNPKTILKAHVGNIGELIMESLEEIIAKENGATIDQINSEIIIKGVELGFLDLLAKEYTSLVPLLRANFDYDVTTKKYIIRENEDFRSKLPLEQRIKYYLIGYLRRVDNSGRIPTFDEIIYNVMPHLKNGVTPNEEDILAVLEVVAERVGGNGWRLRDAVQGNIF